MRVSTEKLRAEAEATGFRQDVLAKVVRLIGVLRGVRDHPYLRGRLALKGGTALNLFVFDVPRLSVDIDLNYIGTGGRDAMLTERTRVEKALTAVFGRENLSVRKAPEEHAGGKWWLRYGGPPGRGGTLEVDVRGQGRPSTESGEAPGWQGATKGEWQRYSSKEQRRAESRTGAEYGKHDNM